ncbi:MAG: hypothetical protein NTW19_09040 [Planctomycetota bacterium]|nr:hypothetical protein [Planctomycetota bacterium]
MAGDVPSVMVELALGATPRELPRVVIVNEPGSIRRVQALLAAVRRYYPGARCWRYEAALPARTGLRPFDEPAAAVTETAASAASTGPAVPSAATPEPHGQRAVAPPPRVKPPASALDAPLVSAEELAMLLGYAESEEQAEADAKARPKGDQGNPPRRASRND